MKIKKTLTTAMILGTICLSGGLLLASELPNRGPLPFASWDKDGNGSIDQQEFETVRQQRQAAMKAGGQMGRNMASAPAFSRIDTDGNGLISAEELTAIQGKQIRYNGKGQAGNKRNMAMGRGHHGNKQGMGNGKGMGYQAMDAETREKYDAFFSATTELRAEIMAKRTAKQAVMRSANPDPDQAAQLTRELLELRAQMRAQADTAGVEIAQGRSNRHGGLGNGCNMRL